MSRSNIHFFSEDLPFNLPQKTALRSWIVSTIKAESYQLKEINFIFCSDSYLLEMNRTYLNHDTFTDIITFDNSEERGIIVGDVFISIDRIRENAQRFGVSETDELHRVMIHGVLHLLGYGDKSKEKKAQMTAKENQYLSLRHF